MLSITTSMHDFLKTQKKTSLFFWDNTSQVVFMFFIYRIVIWNVIIVISIFFCNTIINCNLETHVIIKSTETK